MRLKTRIRNWLDASLGNRLGATMVLLVFGFMFVAGVANLFYLMHQMRTTTLASLEVKISQASEQVRQVLESIQEDTRLLAANPTVVSAVLDVRDQEAYLHPLLLSYSPRGRTPEKLCVTDFSGRAIGCSDEKLVSFAKTEWIRLGILNARPSAHVERHGNGEVRLHLAYPVIFDGSDAAEGAVVAVYDLEKLLMAGMRDADQFVHLHLKSSRGDVYFRGERQGIVHSERGLALDGALADLKLVLSLGVPDTFLSASLFRLLAAYGVIALLLTLAAFLAVRRLVPPLVSRLGDMAKMADAVASGQSGEFAVSEAGQDEVAQLARSFSTLTRRLQEANWSLEATVQSRTWALHQKEALLQSILNAVPGAIFQFRLRPDGSSHVPFASKALAGIIGISPEAVLDSAQPIYDRLLPEDLPAHLASIQASAASLSHWRQDFRICKADGRIAWLHGNAVPEREADGSVLWHGIVTDITEHKQAELALAESDAYNKALFANSYIPLVIIDPETGRFLDCNDAAVEIYQLADRSSVIGLTPLHVSAPEQYDGTASAVAATTHLAAAQEKGLHIFEWRHCRPGNEYWDAEVRLMRFSHGGHQLMQFSLRDITEQKRSQAEIWHKANFDALTGLANRGLCMDRLERAMVLARRNQQEVGILFVDLDGFKAVNDTLGHAAGDQILIEVARRLTHCARQQDTVARFGGDEFVLIIKGLASRVDVRRVAEGVLAAFQQPFAVAGQACPLSCSIGIAVFPEDAEDASELVDLADQALYGSKRAGKNRFQFAEETT